MAVTGMSARFYATLREAHSPAIRGEVWYDGVRVVDNLPISGGSVTMRANDLSRASLSSLQLTDRDRSLLPDNPLSKIGPYGHEIHIYRGIRYSEVLETDDGLEETLVGKFRVQTHSANEIWSRPLGDAYHGPEEWVYVGAEVSVDGLDRAANIVDARFLSPTEPLPGNDVKAEIIRLCSGIITVDTSNFGTLPTKTPPSSVVYQEDRGQAIADLAAAIDCRAFVSRAGLLRLEKIEELPDSLIGVTRATPAVQSIEVETTREGAYNAVVARGESEGAGYPVQGIAYDTDYNSQMAWGGPFGQVPYFYSSPVLGTVQSAQLAAQTRLDNLIKGRTRTFTLTGVPDPTLDPNDKVIVSLPGRDPFPGVIEEITLPLDPTSLMTIKVVALASVVVEV